jgi:hypothetical protein
MSAQGESQGHRRGPIARIAIVCLLVAAAAVFFINPGPEWWARGAGSFGVNPVGWASLALLSTAGLVALLTTPRDRPPVFALAHGWLLLLPWANLAAFTAVLLDQALFDLVMPGGHPANGILALWLFVAFMSLMFMTVYATLAMSTWALVAALRLLGIYEPLARSWARLNR